MYNYMYIYVFASGVYVYVSACVVLCVFALTVPSTWLYSVHLRTMSLVCWFIHVLYACHVWYLCYMYNACTVHVHVHVCMSNVFLLLVGVLQCVQHCICTFVYSVCTCSTNV